MLAIILALDAFNTPVRTMQLRQRRATSLCMEAVNILKQYVWEASWWEGKVIHFGKFQFLPVWQCVQLRRRLATAWAPGAPRSAAEWNFEANRWNSAPNMLFDMTDIWQSPVTRANYQCCPWSKVQRCPIYLELCRLMVTRGVESDILGSVVRDPRFCRYAGSGQT